jgi:hypothetical protein
MSCWSSCGASTRPCWQAWASTQLTTAAAATAAAMAAPLALAVAAAMRQLLVLDSSLCL